LCARHGARSEVKKGVAEFDAHVQARHQAEDVFSAVDQDLDDDETVRGPRLERGADQVGFPSRFQSCRMLPIVTMSALAGVGEEVTGDGCFPVLPPAPWMVGRRRTTTRSGSADVEPSRRTAAIG
jgi:hypothetical protein